MHKHKHTSTRTIEFKHTHTHTHTHTRTEQQHSPVPDSAVIVVGDDLQLAYARRARPIKHVLFVNNACRLVSRVKTRAAVYVANMSLAEAPFGVETKYTRMLPPSFHLSLSAYFKTLHAAPGSLQRNGQPTKHSVVNFCVPCAYAIAYENTFICAYTVSILMHMYMISFTTCR